MNIQRVTGLIKMKSFYHQLFNNQRQYCSFSSMKTVLLFGGQGNQQKGMLDKFMQNQWALNLIKSQSSKLGIDFLQITTTDQSNLINITSYTQPLLLLSQYLQFMYGQKRVDLTNRTKQNTYCIGHSLGEFTSLLISGSINLSDCLRLVHTRGSLMIESSQGQSKLGTLIIKFREDKLPKILQKVEQLKLQVSCYNSPTNIVVSGGIDNLNELKNYMKTQLRIVSKVLPAATAFHSSHLQKMKEQFRKVIETIEFKPPQFQIIRNVDCKIYQNRSDIIQGLTLQNTHPVLFTQSVSQLIKKQGKQNLQFIQIGHKQYLSRWVDEVNKLY